MSEWIELEQVNNDKSIEPVSVRSYCICIVERTGSKSCKVYLDDDQHDVFYTVAEPYEEVMEKIKKAEEPTTVPVVERFTKAEYEETLKLIEDYAEDHALNILQTQVQDVIKQILKEYE